MASEVSEREVLEHLAQVSIFIILSRLRIQKVYWQIQYGQNQEQNCVSLHGLQV